MASDGRSIVRYDQDTINQILQYMKTIMIMRPTDVVDGYFIATSVTLTASGKDITVCHGFDFIIIL
jgi:hypothetical protein